MKNSWSSEDCEYLICNYSKIPTSQISEKVNRTVLAVNKKAIKLGLSAVTKQWTMTEEQLLRDIYPHSSQKDLEQIFDRSWVAIAGKAANLKLKRWTRTGKHSSYVVTLYNAANQVVRQQNFKANDKAYYYVKSIINFWNDRFELMLKNGIYYISVQNNLEKYNTL